MDLKTVGCFLRVGKTDRVPMLEYQMPRHHWHVYNFRPLLLLANSCRKIASLMLIFTPIIKKNALKSSDIHSQVSSGGFSTTLNELLHCIIPFQSNEAFIIQKR